MSITISYSALSLKLYSSLKFSKYSILEPAYVFSAKIPFLGNIADIPSDNFLSDCYI